MEVSSQDPPLMAMDLSKGYSVKPITRGHAEAMDLVKKPEWYHRRPPSCSTERSRSRAATSYSSLPTHPEAGASVHCRDMDQGQDAYMNSTLTPGLELYRDAGVHGNLWHPGFYGPDQSSGPGPESSGGEESDSDSDVIFLVSSAKEPLLCSPFIQEGVRHIVEPLSPAVSSLDEGRGCYHLPQPMSSPSPDSSYSDESSDSSVDIPVHHTRPIVLLSDLSSVYGNPAESPVDISSDDSDVIEVSVTEKKKKSRESSPPNKNEKTPRRGVRHSSRIRKSACEKPRFNCGGSRRSLRRHVKYDAVGIYNESCDSDDMLEYLGRLSSSDAESVAQPKPSQRPSSNSDDSNTENRRKSPSKSPPREERPQRKASYTKRINYKRKKSPAVGTTKKTKNKEEEDGCRVTTRQQQQQQKQQQKQQETVSESRKSSAKKKTAAKRKRKRCSAKQSGPPSLFPFSEPEIKFKYVKIKEEKKEKKSELFSPFVHMEQRRCTVVNYQEEEATMRSDSRRGLTHAACRSASGFVPTTSCFHLGRLSPDSGGLDELRCCLCGQTANAVGLGDLHGPYRPAARLTMNCRLDDDANDRTALKEDQHGLCNSHSDDKSSAGKSLPESDDHSPSKVPLNLNECWIHEDCGIWSAGVFLVRGKLYGLAEAAQLAQQTMCSTCQQTGAITGCFQKGCPLNYHYRCALQSGCILNEDNFSLRCPDHKNKLYATRQQQR